MLISLRIKFFLLGIIFSLIFLIGFNANVFATKSEIKVEEDDEFIWQCNLCDGDKMKDLFGNGWDGNGTGLFEKLKQGGQMKLLIKDTDDDIVIYNTKELKDEEFIGITYNKWFWTRKDVWGHHDIKIQSNYYDNPKDYPDDYILPNIAPIWLPFPIDDYLKKADLYEGYSIDARSIPTISCEVEKNDMKGDYPTEYFKVQAIYNEKGILKSYKLYIENHKVIVDISLETEFIFSPLIWLYLIPAIFALFYIGLIYIIYKKFINN